MQINRSTIFTILITLIVGVLIGALFLGGSGGSSPALDGHEGEGHELTQNEAGQWTCSMHPQVRQSEAGACPFCGMDLIPVATNDDGDPTVLKMSNSAIQLANIQTSTIGEGALNGVIELSGKVRADERRVNTQTTHFAGRIERLYKDYEGQPVKKGDKLASLHSPELIAAQEELIEAKKLQKTNPVLLEAARKKLKYWKLTDAQIDVIEQASEPMRNFDILADYDGVITKKIVNTGIHLHEGGALMEITDLSGVWVVFEVYERDLAKVKLGDKIMFKARSLREEMEATISFIYPDVNPQTRVVEVRADVRNGNRLLKPDMFVDAELSVSSSQSLLVPKSAVLWTGKRSVVYIRNSEDLSFSMREIVLGESMGDHYVVESGLNVGDEVVTNGAFTLDAEAQLQGKISMMSPAKGSGNVVSPESPFIEVELSDFQDFREEVTPAFQEQLSALFSAYIQLKDQMVEGEGGKIRKAGVLVKDALEKVDMTLAKGAAHVHWMQVLKPMETSLSLITTSGNRDLQRLQFINLSKALINAVQSFGTSFESPLYIQFCPMANNDKGATWISTSEEIINPYFGDVMLNCGNVEDIIMNVQ